MTTMRAKQRVAKGKKGKKEKETINQSQKENQSIKSLSSNSQSRKKESRWDENCTKKPDIKSAGGFAAQTGR